MQEHVEFLKLGQLSWRLIKVKTQPLLPKLIILVCLAVISLWLSSIAYQWHAESNAGWEKTRNYQFDMPTRYDFCFVDKNELSAGIYCTPESELKCMLAALSDENEMYNCPNTENFQMYLIPHSTDERSLNGILDEYILNNQYTILDAQFGTIERYDETLPIMSLQSDALSNIKYIYIMPFDSQGEFAAIVEAHSTKPETSRALIKEVRRLAITFMPASDCGKYPNKVIDKKCRELY